MTRAAAPAGARPGTPDPDGCRIGAPGCRGGSRCRHKDLDLPELASDPNIGWEELLALATANLDGPYYRAALAALLRRPDLCGRPRRVALKTAASIPATSGWYRPDGGANSADVWAAALSRNDLTGGDLLTLLAGTPPDGDTVDLILDSPALTPLAEATLAYRVRERGATQTSADLRREAALVGHTPPKPIAVIAYALSGLPAAGSHPGGPHSGWTPKTLLRRVHTLLHSPGVDADTAAAVIAALGPNWAGNADSLLIAARHIVRPAGGSQR